MGQKWTNLLHWLIRVGWCQSIFLPKLGYFWSSNLNSDSQCMSPLTDANVYVMPPPSKKNNFCNENLRMVNNRLNLALPSVFRKVFFSCLSLSCFIIYTARIVQPVKGCTCLFSKHKPGRTWSSQHTTRHPARRHQGCFCMTAH